MEKTSNWLAAPVICALVVIVGPACTSTHSPAGTSVNCPHAQCPCCVRNGDLACIDLVIEPSTPSWQYEGTTYYFCSDDCRNAFVKDPRRYLGQ
jgi:YHS domain-containing protein